jgi:hypothetical protein
VLEDHTEVAVVGAMDLETVVDTLEVIQMQEDQGL